MPSRIGRRPIRRARVLVRKPHTQRRQRLIRAIAVGTVRVERRYNMQPSAAVAQEVVATRTTALDCAVNARVGMCNRREAKKPQDNHRSHRDDNRPHDRSTLVQADKHIELNRTNPQGRGLRRSASARGSLRGRRSQPGHHAGSIAHHTVSNPAHGDGRPRIQQSTKSSVGRIKPLARTASNVCDLDLCPLNEAPILHLKVAICVSDRLVL